MNSRFFETRTFSDSAVKTVKSILLKVTRTKTLPPPPPPLLCEHGHKSCTYVRSKSWRSLEAGQTSLQEFLIWSTSTRWKAKSTMFWTRGPYIRDAIGQILNSPCQHHGNCLPTAQVTFLQNTDKAFFVNIKFLSAGNVSKTLRFCSSFIFL